MSLKPWREVAVPHADVLKGTFQQAEFAADISRVHAGTAAPEYQKAQLFFQRTFITEGMRLLLDSVVKRLAGRGGEPVIQLQTAFGGGKTHTMLAVYHLAKGEATASELPGVPPILDAAGVTELPRARVAVLDGIKASPNQPVRRGDQTIHTLWGELAWQLAGAEGYALVAEADRSGTSPGKAVLEQLLARSAPCVVLVDEMVAYVRQFEDGKALTGGTFDSNLTFVQALTEAMKAVPNAVLLASLPESAREAGSQRGEKALASLSHYFGRVQALWKPVGTEEAFEIVRRRLFSEVGDRRAAEDVCRAFADFYAAGREDFPSETQESRYFDRLLAAYPIHPEVFDRLYEDWSSLDNFQRTRGVLKLMAQVIHRLWKDGNNDLLLMPGSLPLYDADTRNNLMYYLPAGWDPVIERDVDGERAETTEIENKDTRLGSLQACRRAARTVFLGSAPSTANQSVRGIEPERVVLGAAQPGQQLGVYRDALRRLSDRLHYLSSGNNRFWFDTRPNLRREMEDRKRRYQDRDDVFPAVRERIARSSPGAAFNATHVFTESGDIGDDWALRLVVLPPDAGFSRSGPCPAIDKADEILRNRGTAPRTKQNRLLFLVPDADNVSRLRDQTRSVLAWQSIVADVREGALNLDQHQAKQAGKSLDDANEALRRMVRETYRWLLAPVQQAQPGKGVSAVQWEHFPVNPGAANVGQEIERVLTENELVIKQWAPIHLARLLRQWFWKDDLPEAKALEFWQKSCEYLYLPRLKDDTVLQAAISSGVESRDFFGAAQGKDPAGSYVGFVFGQRTTVILDKELLLIEPATALEFALRAREPDPTKPTPPPTPAPTVPPRRLERRFYGSVDLSPVLAMKQFSTVVEEVIAQFVAKPGVEVRISVEIEAHDPAGFNAETQRAVSENCRSLRFKQAGFEQG